MAGLALPVRESLEPDSLQWPARHHGIAEGQPRVVQGEFNKAGDEIPIQDSAAPI